MIYIIKNSSYRLLKNKLNEITNNIEKNNIIYFDLTIDTLKDILESCSYNSLFNDKKCIIVNNTNLFSTKFEYKEELKLLENYYNNQNNNTILIFLCNNVSIQKKIVKTIKENKCLIELDIPVKEELTNSVKQYIKTNNYSIDNNALELIIRYNNNNYDYILNELDKIFIIKKDNRITKEDVEKYSTKIENFDLFYFIDLIIKKNIIESLKYLEIIEESNIEPSIIFANIASQYRLIYCVKNLIKDNYSELDIHKETGKHQYSIKLAHESSINYTNEELENKLLNIGEIDKNIKLGVINKYNALKIFIINM